LDNLCSTPQKQPAPNKIFFIVLQYSKFQQLVQINYILLRIIRPIFIEAYFVEI
jgi:hypothetical protein